MDTPAPAASPPAAISLRNLRGSLLLLAASALVAAASATASWHLLQQAELERQNALARQTETRARLARVHDDEREIRQRIERYQEIGALGRTETERRLEWVETLAQIRDERRLSGLDYEISPQRPLDAKAPAAGGFDFLASPMKLEAQLLHEGELLGLLDDLQARVQALIGVRRCRIERLPPGTPQAANLKAACELDWITLQARS